MLVSKDFREYLQKQLIDPEFKKEYDALAAEYFLRQIFSQSTSSKLAQNLPRRERFRHLPIAAQKISDEVCALCDFHQRDGFTEGLELGVKLGNELNT